MSHTWDGTTRRTLGPRRAAGTNPRTAIGYRCSKIGAGDGATHPRAVGTNPRAVGTNPQAVAALSAVRSHRETRAAVLAADRAVRPVSEPAGTGERTSAPVAVARLCAMRAALARDPDDPVPYRLG